MVGAAVVIVATLFAPGKASETRNKITRKGKLYRDYMMDNFHDFADSVTHPFENLEDKTMRLSTIVRSKANEMKTELNNK